MSVVQTTCTFYALTFCLKTLAKMESQNIELRAVLMFLTKEGANAKEIHWCMADVYGDSSPKYSKVTTVVK